MKKHYSVTNLIIRRPFWAPNPDLYSGVGLIALALFVLFLLVLFRSPYAQAQGMRDRTVTWYVQNQAALDLVTQLCRDNPGRYRTSPDCVNADAARIIVGQRETERLNEMRGGGRVARPNDMTPPSSPQYWRDRPEERREKLAYCNRMRPSEQARFFCEPAREADNGPKVRRS